MGPKHAIRAVAPRMTTFSCCDYEAKGALDFVTLSNFCMGGPIAIGNHNIFGMGPKAYAESA